MNRSASLYQDSRFGPPSEPIDIGQFLASARELDSISTSGSAPSVSPLSKLNIPAFSEFKSLPSSRHEALSAQCSVDDISTQLNATLSSPILTAHIIRSHRAVLSSIFDAVDTSKSRRRARRDVMDPENETNAEVRELQASLDTVQLRAMKLDMQSAIFLRTSTNSDYNALSSVKMSTGSNQTASINAPLQPLHDVVITVSIHTPVPWATSFITRTSSHVLLSSHTLGDILDAVPCTSTELPPAKTDEDGNLTGFTPVTDGRGYVSTGAVICIDGVVYGDGESEEDYSDKLLKQLETLGDEKRAKLTKGAGMHDVPLSSLSVRLQEPYWVLHAGGCTHFLVFDEIRLSHQMDPQSPANYPLTTYIQPITLDMCRACAKVPAVWAIVGDLRLGESPCMMCAPCWRTMGIPKGVKEGQVIVIPLPKHELGW